MRKDHDVAQSCEVQVGVAPSPEIERSDNGRKNGCHGRHSYGKFGIAFGKG